MKEKCKEYVHFRHEEIVFILQMRDKGFSLRDIGRKIGRGENAAGSISRFLARNKHPFPGVWKELDVYERARDLYERAAKKRKIPRKSGKLASDPELEKSVIELLVEEQSSPRDISFRIAEKFPGKHIAYTTIYNFTKYDRTDLREHHRLKGKPRKQNVVRKGRSTKKGAPEKTRIAQRSPAVAERTEFGHFEADTIHSCKNSSGYPVLTVRELKSRNRWFFLLANLLAATTLAALQGFFRRLPPHMRKTLTVDNGPENEHLYKLETVFTGFKVY
jgi:IS30 family transposase